MQPRATLVIRNCGELLTLADGPLPRRGPWLRELAVLHGAAIAIKGEEIIWTGPDPDLDRNIDVAEAEVVDAGGRLVMPAFIDPHTHLVFSGDRSGEFAARLMGRNYQEIEASGGGIPATVRATRAAVRPELLASARARLREAVVHGTTTLEVKSGYGLNLADEIKSLEVIRELSGEGLARLVPTYLGAHAIPPEWATAGDYVEYIASEVLPQVASRGLAKFCDCFMEDGYFDAAATRQLFAEAWVHGFGLRLHADEFGDSGGAQLACEFGAASADHLLGVGSDGIQALSACDTIAVLMPGTPFTLRLGRYAPARAMIDAGVAVALGSDYNPGTCLISSMQAVVSLACLEMGLTPAEAIQAATVNAACSLGLGHVVGRIAPGLAADLIILEAASHVEIPFRIGVNLVKRVVHRGQTIWQA
jgi:imidazolonepropionase